MSQILTDELGLSFQLKENDGDTLSGKECIFTNINTVNSIANFVSTSLGPNGMDKILVDQDDNITVTNDGATILKEMGMSSNPISRLILQLSQSQDEEVGDGTTSIVILASAILNQGKSMLEKGMHPIKIMEGFNEALKLSLNHLDKISEPINDLKSIMLKTAKTALSSKIVSISNFAEICVEAVLTTADMKRKDLDMELIHIQSKLGGNLSDTRLIKGIAINKSFSHIQMQKNMKNAKVALLSCPFEPPKLKTKASLLIQSANEYKELENYEQNLFEEMINSLKNVKADIVLCQWGFDDEANSLLQHHNIPAIRWVGGHELGLIATHISGSIIANFRDLTESSLGFANIREESIGTENEKVIIIETSDAIKTNSSNIKNMNDSTTGGTICSSDKKCVTIFIRGSTEQLIEEAKRSIHDGISAVRNILISDRIIYGGGSAEISTSIFLSEASKNYSAEVEDSIKAFSNALIEIPLILASNSGFEPISYVDKLIELQMNTKDFTIGVDCLDIGEKSMKKAEVFESFHSKARQLQMATELACMILKIDDAIPFN